jgi:hypothetical protein
MCWSAAVAAFVVYFAISVAVVVGRDGATVLIATLLGITGALQKYGEDSQLPWWWYLMVSVALLGRVAFVTIQNRQRLLIVSVWARSCNWAVEYRRKQRLKQKR